MGWSWRILSAAAANEGTIISWCPAPLQFLTRQQAAGYFRLIRGGDEQVTCLLEAPQRLPSIPVKVKVLRPQRTDWMLSLHPNQIQYAIPFQKHTRFHAS